MSLTTQRDERIDLLRFIGLAMVILAHVYPPFIVAQLRNFDVPLMVLVSALSFSASVKQESYGQYVWARVKRLVFPVWLFLALYFALQWAFAFPVVLPSVDTIARTFGLIDGIGYVWVIRIFLLVALIGPFVYRFHQREASDLKYFGTLALTYAVFQAMVWWLLPELTGTLKTFLLNTIFYVLPYGAVFAFGLRVPAMLKPELWRWFMAFTVLFVALALWYFSQTEQFKPTQHFKYPPQHYYLAYALMVSLALWLAAASMLKLLYRVRLIAFVMFAGSNSIWIYLWHIFFLQIFKIDWLTNYLLVFICSAAVTWLQVTLVNKYLVAPCTDPQKRRNIKALLTG